MIAVADTGFVVALLHRRDKNHIAAAAVYQRVQTAYLPQSALAEVAYLLTNRAGGEAFEFIAPNTVPSSHYCLKKSKIP
jgi:predicted nucleic acid-binding protein